MKRFFSFLAEFLPLVATIVSAYYLTGGGVMVGTIMAIFFGFFTYILIDSATEKNIRAFKSFSGFFLLLGFIFVAERYDQHALGLEIPGLVLIGSITLAVLLLEGLAEKPADINGLRRLIRKRIFWFANLIGALIALRHILSGYVWLPVSGLLIYDLVEIFRGEYLSRKEKSVGTTVSLILVIVAGCSASIRSLIAGYWLGSAVIIFTLGVGCVFLSWYGSYCRAKKVRIDKDSRALIHENWFRNIFLKSLKEKNALEVFGTIKKAHFDKKISDKEELELAKYLADNKIPISGFFSDVDISHLRRKTVYGEEGRFGIKFLEKVVFASYRDSYLEPIAQEIDNFCRDVDSYDYLGKEEFFAFFKNNARNSKALLDLYRSGKQQKNRKP